MQLNSLQLKDSIHQMVEECRSIVNLCKNEKREMTEEESTHFDELKQNIEARKQDLANLEAKLQTYEDNLPNEERTKEKNINSNRSMKQTLIKEIRNALDNNIKSIKVNAETRTMTVQGYGEGAGAVEGVHDQVIETEIQGILEPLYANSVLAQLGVKFYPGLPQGDIQIPIMGKSNVGWAGEIEAATATGNSFTTKKLSPKRLTAYVDISKQLIYQDTIGVEAAIRRDIVNALNDKLEATILGVANKTDNQPAGIFYGQTINTCDTFAKICNLEATVENANVTGQMKYLLSPGAKAELRAMAKSTKSTQLVFEGGEVDGVPAVVTSNVAGKNFVYGDFSNIAVGSWGDIEITIDEYTQAVNGCVRLVINAYFDEVILRPEALAFGKTSA
jgi:HK97 family phage major capsid protein